MNEVFTTVIDRTAGNAEKYALRKKLFKTDDVLPMWVADMDIRTPECVSEAVEARARHPIYGYEEMPDSAFEAQAAWLRTRYAFQTRREWYFFSPSVVATINLVINAFTKEGEGVVVQPPVYPPFMHSVTHNNRRLILNPLKVDAEGVYRFDFEDLLAGIDGNTRLLLLCSPHNPVGRVWEREELERLAEICTAHNITVLADEVHCDLVFAPHRHIPFASLSEAARAMTITAAGPGKSFNMAGLSISTAIIADETVRERFRHAYDAIHFAQGNIFAHAAFEAAYRKGGAWIEALMAHLASNVAMLAAVIETHKAIISWNPPQGTYLAWLDCRGMGLGDRKLRTFFIEKAGLGLSPGITFGREGSGFMRLNLAVPTPLMRQACDGLDSALTQFTNEESDD